MMLYHLTNIVYKHFITAGYQSIYICHKRQKLSKRKVFRFTGFYPNVEKASTIFAMSVLKVLPMLKASIGKTFVIH